MKKATVKKPVLDTSQALKFATGETDKEKPGIDSQKTPKITYRRNRGLSGVVPEGDVRLTANIREDVHLKLKIAAAHGRTTIGELIEELVGKHLSE